MKTTKQIALIMLAFASIAFTSCEPKVDISTLSETGKLVHTLEQAIGLKKDKAIEKMSHYTDEQGYVVINEMEDKTNEVGERTIAIQERTMSKYVNCIIFDEVFDISTPEAVEEFRNYYSNISTEVSLYHKGSENYSGNIGVSGDREIFEEYEDFNKYITNKSFDISNNPLQEQYFATKNRSTILSTALIEKGRISFAIRVQHDGYPN